VVNLALALIICNAYKGVRKLYFFGDGADAQAFTVFFFEIFISAVLELCRKKQEQKLKISRI
jgi:hypothetical protein